MGFFQLDLEECGSTTILIKRKEKIMSKEIRSKINILRKKMNEKKKRISSLKGEYLSLEEEYSALQRKLSLLDIPVISVDLYNNESDEFERTGEFETEDFLDKRLDLNTSWEGKRASVSVAVEGSHCAEYSMDERPLSKICSGKVKFTYVGGGENGVYESELVDSPNNVQGLIYFFRAMHYVEDTHHCYLEGYEIKKENGISIVEFISGS